MADSSNSGGGSRTTSFILVALVAAIIGAAAAHFAPFAMGHGGWHHRGGWGHHGFRHEMSSADMQEHLDHMVSHIAREADATDEQKTKIAAIAKAAATDLQPLHQQLFEAHTKALALFRAPTIDRAALEALRVEQIQRIDAATKRLAQALADVAEVLTPDQRTKMAEHFDRFSRDRD